MSKIVQTVGASLNTADQFQLTPRLNLPTIVSREQAKELARKLWSSDATSFAGVSRCADNDALACKVVALAIGKLVFGEHSRLDRAERYAATLPEYKKSKAGEIVGSIGKRIALLREAVIIGGALREKLLNVDSINEFNLASIFGQSPTLGAMLAPPAPKKIATEDATITAAHKEAQGRLEAEKLEAEKLKAEKLEAEKLTVKISEQSWQEGLAMLGAPLDNTMADEWSQCAMLESNRAERLASEKAEQEALIARQLRREGESLTRKIHAFCDLANELGIKLSAAQLKTLDQLEFKAA